MFYSRVSHVFLSSPFIREIHVTFNTLITRVLEIGLTRVEDHVVPTWFNSVKWHVFCSRVSYVFASLPFLREIHVTYSTLIIRVQSMVLTREVIHVVPTWFNVWNYTCFIHVFLTWLRVYLFYVKYTWRITR